MEMDIYTLAVGLVAVLLASFFATVSGFGFALICAPLLSIVLPLKSVVIFVPFLSIIMRLATMYTTFKDVDWKVIAMICAGCLVGIIPGSLILKVLPAWALGALLGSVLIVAVVLMALRLQLVIKNKTLGRLGAGLIAGFFGAATSVNGPPIALYFLNEQMEKTQMRANMIWIFGVNFLVTATTYFFVDTYSVVDDWSVFYYLLPANFLGLYIGEKFAKKVSQELFRKLSMIIVAAGGIMMLVSSIGKII